MRTCTVAVWVTAWPAGDTNEHAARSWSETFTLLRTANEPSETMPADATSSRGANDAVGSCKACTASLHDVELSSRLV